MRGHVSPLKWEPEIIVECKAGILAQEVHGEMVLLDLESENYFGLNETGARVWVLLQEGRALPDLFERLAEEFNADRARMEADVLSLISQLAEAGLVDVRR